MGLVFPIRMEDPDGVGSAALEKWRKDGLGQWNKEVCRKLKQQIMKSVKVLEPYKELNIIVCGGTGHGKSSLINNCLAALSGIYAQVAQVGRGTEQITEKYQKFQAWEMENGSASQLPLSFYDTRGFSESTELGVPVAAIKACIMGKVKHGQTIDRTITDEDWEKKEPIDEKVSYIFFVADATDISNTPGTNTPGTSNAAVKTIYINLRQISEFAKKEGIQVAAFLTKCDILDPDVKQRTSNLHYSKLVEKEVYALSEMVNIEENRVFPVANYREQIDVNSEMQIQTLLALNACLHDIVAISVTNITRRN